MAALLGGCISKTTYDEVAQSRDYYKKEFQAADTLRIVNADLEAQNRYLEADLNKARRELDQATVTNLALRRNYDELLAEYNRAVTSTREIVSSSAYEKQNLTERYATQQAELDRKQREVVTMEYALQAREDRLNAVDSYETTGFGARGAAGAGASSELATLLETQRRQMTQLQQSLGSAMAAFGPSAAQVSMRDNRVVLTLSHSLLFSEGGFQPGVQGMRALNTAAAVLASYPDVEVLVIGRGDSYGASDVNWEYGVQRASEIGRSLASGGVNASRILAAGQGPGYSGAFGIRAVINQTDIILSPNMDRVNQLLAR